MKSYFSVAEAFQRGIEKVTQPHKGEKVSYCLRIYPAIHVDVPEAMKREMDDFQRRMTSLDPDKIKEEFETIKRRYPPSKAEVYGWTASFDYCNDSANELVHRGELTRTDPSELVAELLIFESVITDERQVALYRKLMDKLLRFFAGYASKKWELSGTLVLTVDEGC